MSARHDFYGPVHKGLRFASAQLLIRLGSNDWQCARASAALIAALRHHLEVARAHLEHEEAEFHPVLRARAPELADALDHDHAEHHATFDALAALIAAVEAAVDAERPAAAHRLYLRYSLYVSDDLAHMASEELEVQPIAHALFTDAELQAIEGRIVASIPPEQMAESLSIMLPAMTPLERATFLRNVGAGAPPEAFAMIRDVIARNCLSQQDHARLVGELALAA
ncbi:hemerythrin domain-containing protein [Sphingomonas sp. ST-64]|uniref:Hemerythrin domain-containing protein n=1 Tax=Sphingomonas plantiphila TaxID=3163295 RepID=A0ABW8YH25_9SPHN